MKPVWTQTLVWIATVVAALLLAWAGPDSLGISATGDDYGPQGAITPR